MEDKNHKIILIPPRNEFLITSKSGAVFIWINNIVKNTDKEIYVFDSKIQKKLFKYFNLSFLNFFITVEIILHLFKNFTKSKFIIHNDVFIFQIISLIHPKTIFHSHNEYQKLFNKKLYLNKYENIIVCSKFLKNKYNNIFKYTFYVPNGISNTDDIKNINDRKYDLGFVGRNDDNKNFKGFIETLFQTNIKKLKVLVIGFDYEELNDDTKNDIKKLKQDLELNFCFSGKLAHKEVLIKFKNLKILWHMPKYNEAFGMVVLESLSRGCHLVVRDFKGISEIIKDTIYTGIYELDYKLASNYIKKYIDSNHNSKYPFINNYYWESITKSYFKLIDEKF